MNGSSAKLLNRLISMLVSAFLLAGLAPAGVFAAGTQDTASVGAKLWAAVASADPAPYTKSGRFQFAESVLYSSQSTDEYYFSEEWFRQSSYNENLKLAKLSMQTTLASVSYFDPAEDRSETDPSNNAYNLKNLLSDIGFRDIQTNAYYSVEEREKSMAACAGHMNVISGNKTYTLIALVPRSDNYKQEWAGNFIFGKGDVHAGFKAARDEMLRFLKKYIADNNISGALKIWIPGHSRGGAVANMTGGFLAGGGAAYLGEKVSITPQDIYCYCFAAPLPVRTGASKAEELSVEGCRGDSRYADDTEGKAYEYNGGGTLDPKASVYSGIWVYSQNEDLVTKVPPAKWGLGCYGRVQTASGNVKWNEMTEVVKRISPSLYSSFTNGVDPSGFRCKTFDPVSLSMVEDKSRLDMTMAEFLDERAAALAYAIPDNEIYVDEGYQDALSAAAGIYGMLASRLLGGSDRVQSLDTSALIKPVALTYLAYAAERISSEYAEKGKTLTETEAIGIWIAGFANYISGLEIPEDPNADYVVYALAEFIAQNPDSETANRVAAKFSGGMSNKTRAKLNAFVPSEDIGKVSDEELLKAFLIACARGAADDTVASWINKGLYADAKECRKELYGELSNLMSQYPQLAAAIDNGNGSLTDVAAASIDILTAGSGGDGNASAAETRLGDAADTGLKEAVSDYLYKGAEAAGEDFGSSYPDYYSDVTGHIETVMDKMALVRRTLAYFLFYTQGGDCVSSALGNACTFVSNSSFLIPEHYGEGYTAWMTVRADAAAAAAAETIASGGTSSKAEKAAASSVTVKKEQKLTIKVRKKTVKRSALKKKKKKVSAIRVSGAKTKLTYKKKSGSSRLKVNSKTGRIIVKKGTKKGWYKIKVTVSAAASTAYNAASKTVTVRVRVK